jgi:hypothetical protein
VVHSPSSASLNEELNYIRRELLIRGDGCRMRSRLLECMGPEVALRVDPGID